MNNINVFYIYLLIISLASICFTAIDKAIAVSNGAKGSKGKKTKSKKKSKSKKKEKTRVSEAFLFTLAIVGGALSMLITMKIIRHKTKHKRFMIGLPVIIILQILLIYVIKNNSTIDLLRFKL